MDPNQSSQSWRQALGSQIKEAREKAGLSQEQLGKAIGKSRQIIGRYEAGHDAPSVDVFGSIALQLTMKEVHVNGFRFFVKHEADSPSGDLAEQLKLEFNKEHVYSGATLKITPTEVSVTITAVAPLLPMSSRPDDKKIAS